jgi:hypothetical protein
MFNVLIFLLVAWFTHVLAFDVGGLMTPLMASSANLKSARIPVQCKKVAGCLFCC